MKRLLVFLLLAGLRTIQAGPFDDILAEYEETNAPGYAVGICKKGKPIFSKGIGLADLEEQTPITPDTVFDLASVSKQFTAAAVLLLVERGKLDLDSPVKEVLPEFQVPDKKRPITVRDLLHHISGIADYGSEQWDESGVAASEYTNENHLQWLNETEPLRAPGVKFEYNNSGYVLLASIVEKVSGTTLTEFLRENIFEPVGMESTFVYDGTKALPEDAAVGYAPNGKGKWRKSVYLVPTKGDGNVYSSVNDMMKWDKALRSDQILSKESRLLAWTNGKMRNGSPIRMDESSGYGFGWVVDDRGLVSHSGSWSGTATYYILDPVSGISVIALSNNEDANMYELAEALLAAALEQ